MPQVSGIELCQAVRADPKWQGLPILFLTASSDRSYIQQIFTTPRFIAVVLAARVRHQILTNGALRISS